MEAAVVSAILGALANKVRILAAGEFSLLWGLEGEIQKLRDHLDVIVPVIKDAEEEAETREVVRAWLRRLKRVAYDADDVFDVLKLEAALRPGLLLQADAGVGARLTKSVRACFLSCFTAAPNPLLFRHRMVSRIRDIKTRVGDIVMTQGLLNLKAISGNGLPETSRMRETTHIQDVRLPLLGREEDKHKIIEMLCKPRGRGPESSVGGGARVAVVAIVGLGGIGKTTLAQAIYNDDLVKAQFQRRRWLFVGEKFDGSKLIRDIIKERDSKASKDELHSLLKKAIKDDRFFIVLDDVWTDRRHEWDELFAPLASGSKGGVVLVTTRSRRNIAKTMGEGEVFLWELGPLADEECSSIFETCAFGNLDPKSYPELRKIGKEIVQKVGGSPLGLGGFLCKTLQKEEWENVLRSEVWSHVLFDNNILPILMLSYQNLPSRLKRCFAYCAVFPRDFKFYKETLVEMWMAQGYIETEEHTKMEDVGSAYFDELLDRSFFQHIHVTYVMHDLVHGLAQRVSKDECLRIEAVRETSQVPEDVHHLSLYCDRGAPIDAKGLCKFKRARTLIHLGGDDSGTFHSALSNLFTPVRSIRVLDLSLRGDRGTLPDSIGDLKHLRYLKLTHFLKQSHLRRIRLPESLCKLHNLQTLRVDGCYKLPKGMCKLVNLRHLEAHNYEISKIGRLRELTCLQELSRFSVSKERRHGHKISELMGMNQLRHLAIRDLQNLGSGVEAAHARLKDKLWLCSLKLQWSVLGSTPSPGDQGVLEELQPPGDLKELAIDSHCGSRPPGWMMKPSEAPRSPLHNLAKLVLHRCRWWTQLPPLGQLPSLRFLEIEDMPHVGRVGPEFFFSSSSSSSSSSSLSNGHVGGGCSNDAIIEEDVTAVFPTLEVLCFKGLPGWESWYTQEEAGAQKALHCRQFFPRLCKLEIIECPRLASISPLLFEVIDSHLKALQTAPTRGLTLKCEDCPRLHLMYPSTFGLLTDLDIEDRDFLTWLLGRPKKALQSIQSLHISSCDGLVEFTEDEEEAWRCSFPSLRDLVISSCHNLRSLPAGLHNLPSLQHLEIDRCSKICALPESGLPFSLQHLKASSCFNLRSLPAILHRLPSLELLVISDCPSIDTLPDNGLPHSLETLFIRGCPLLKESCMKDEGPDCHKIENIPFIDIY